MISLKDFNHEVWQSIPLTQTMGVEYRRYQSDDKGGRLLSCHLPLLPNINDKDTAFGGSIATLATLSGWSLTTLLSRELKQDAEVVVYKSSMDYLAPIHRDFFAIASSSADAVGSFEEDLQQKGKAKLLVNVEIFPQGLPKIGGAESAQVEKPAAVYQGYYAAKLKGSPAPQ